MKKTNCIKSVIALLLVSVMAFGICSCKSKKENENVSETDASNVYVSSDETADVTTTTQSEQMTAQPEPTTASALTEPFTSEQTTAAKTARKTQAEKTSSAATRIQQESPEKTDDAKGNEILKDGNKTVVYPLALRTSKKKYPVIAWANGTGCPTQLYTALLKEFADGGYIVIADADVMAADGKSQINSVDYILSKGKDPSSIFYNKVDDANVGACGHSQGGRSSVNAAQADSRIRCVVSIAGASSADEARGLRTPSLFLTGTNDLVVVSSMWCKPSYDAVAGTAAYASLKGAVHTTCMISPKKISAYALDWFNVYLRNDAESLKVFEDGGKLANDKAWKDFQNKNL